MDTIQKFELFDFEFEFRGVHEFERIRGEFEFERIRANSNPHPYSSLLAQKQARPRSRDLCAAPSGTDFSSTS